jgi:hypothetical protein
VAAGAPEPSRTTAAPDDLGNQIAWRTAVARVDARRDGQRAAPIAREAVELAERTDAPSMQGDALMAEAEVQQLAGDADAARSAAERALERYRSKGITASAGRAQTLLEALAAGDAARR